MLRESHFCIQFLGVRGSFTTPGASTVRYGGRTSSLLAECGEHILLFDAGSGLFNIIPRLRARTEPVHLFLTHTHLDHIMGLPGFLPATAPMPLHLWSGHLPPEKGLRDVLNQIMTQELFPLPLHFFDNRCTYHRFAAGEALTPYPGITLRTMMLNHPGGAVAYRLEYAGRSACYVTDHEMGVAAVDTALQAFITGADIAIMDTTYTRAEMPNHKGWGHSAYEDMLELAKAAGVKAPFIFHHDPARSDDALDGIAAAATTLHPGARVASEGLRLHLSA